MLITLTAFPTRSHSLLVSGTPALDDPSAALRIPLETATRAHVNAASARAEAVFASTGFCATVASASTTHVRDVAASLTHALRDFPNSGSVAVAASVHASFSSTVLPNASARVLMPSDTDKVLAGPVARSSFVAAITAPRLASSERMASPGDLASAAASAAVTAAAAASFGMRWPAKSRKPRYAAADADSDGERPKFASAAAITTPSFSGFVPRLDIAAVTTISRSWMVGAAPGLSPSRVLAAAACDRLAAAAFEMVSGR